MIGHAATAAPVFAAGESTTYVLEKTYFDDAYGNYGQIYRYPWTEFSVVGPKNVSSIYINDPEYQDAYGVEWFVEIGMSCDYVDEMLYGQGNVWTFLSFSDPYTGIPKGPYMQAPMLTEDAWVSYEINNHQMYAPGASSWYAAWNGHTVLHGLAFPGYFYQGRPFAASERWSVGDARSSFRYMQYKRIQDNWAAWPSLYADDHDSLYDSFIVDDYPVKFYMYKDGVAP